MGGRSHSLSCVTLRSATGFTRLRKRRNGFGPAHPPTATLKTRICSREILPGFDQETRDFYRWRVEYTPEELGDLIKSRLDIDLGKIAQLEALDRGPSGRIYRLKITGERGSIVVGKELEIRRALSRSHLYSSAFVVDREPDRFVLRGAGWGHGVGLCQIGAAVMAEQGKGYEEILKHYYPGTQIGISEFGNRISDLGSDILSCPKSDIRFPKFRLGSNVRREPDHFKPANNVPADIDLPPVAAEARRSGTVVMIAMPVLAPCCYLKRAKPPDVLAGVHTFRGSRLQVQQAVHEAL